MLERVSTAEGMTSSDFVRQVIRRADWDLQRHRGQVAFVAEVMHPNREWVVSDSTRLLGGARASRHRTSEAAAHRAIANALDEGAPFFIFHDNRTQKGREKPVYQVAVPWKGKPVRIYTYGTDREVSLESLTQEKEEGK